MTNSTELTRRRFIAAFSGLGISSTLLPGVLWALVQDEEEPVITPVASTRIFCGDKGSVRGGTIFIR